MTLRKYKISIVFLLLALVVSIILGVSVGSSDIQFMDSIKILTNNIIGKNIFVTQRMDIINTIIWDIRVPRVLLAAITGAGLSICGILIQTITRNPISDSYVLGISSGASAGAVVVIVLGGAIIGVAFGAFIGAMICGVLVLMFGTSFGKSTSSTKLVLAGISISAIFSAVTNLVIYSADNSNQASAAMFWIMGSFGGARWENIKIPLLVLVVVVVGGLLLSKSLDLLLLGDLNASMLGVNVLRLKIIIIIAVTLLTAIIVSVTGAIGFVGIIIPHIARKFVGSNHRRIIPISVLLGAVFLVLSDILSRYAFAPRELPIGIITAIIGGPFFIWLVVRNKYSFGGE
ncbi:MAG: FecCD family ABC transporter permease [Sarcina sp.]